MWCWIVENSEAIRVVLLSLGLLGGGVGLYFAGWRCVIADRNLLRERCQKGMELLSLNPDHYVARVAGASILSDILDSDSKEYEQSILRAFEAFLDTAPVFGTNPRGHKQGETNYESRDTVLIVTALRRYVKKPNALHLRPLSPGAVFTITEDTVEPNEKHPHYDLWMFATNGRPPDYSD